MSDGQKTVFISYRRANSRFLALLLFKELTERGFDVFIDTERIDAGDFGRIILSQIASRTHFVLILRPGSLDDCVDDGDWVRREIEYAIEKNRNIIPLQSDGFDFEVDGKPYLTGKLSDLPGYNGINLYSDYFDAAVEKLVTRFLKAPEYDIQLETVNELDAEIVGQRLQKVEETTRPDMEAVSAEAFFAHGYAAEAEEDYDKAYLHYTRAISLKPNYIRAYYNRGNVEYHRGNVDAALRDYEQAILLDTDYAKPHLNRALILLERGDEENALRDIELAIRLKPDLAASYYNRAMIRQNRGLIEEAIDDYEIFLSLEKNDLSHIEQAQQAIRVLTENTSEQTTGNGTESGQSDSENLTGESRFSSTASHFADSQSTPWREVTPDSPDLASAASTGPMPGKSADEIKMLEQFRETKRQATHLRRMRDRGQIDQNTLQSEMQKLPICVNDVWWMIGFESDEWYYYNDQIGDWELSEAPVAVGDVDVPEDPAYTPLDPAGSLPYVSSVPYYDDYSYAASADLDSGTIGDYGSESAFPKRKSTLESIRAKQKARTDAQNAGGISSRFGRSSSRFSAGYSNPYEDADPFFGRSTSPLNDDYSIPYNDNQSTNINRMMLIFTIGFQVLLSIILFWNQFQNRRMIKKLSTENDTDSDD